VKQVLLVDDEPDILEYLRDELELIGYVVSTASSVTAACNELSHKQFDLVISDVIMPELTGFDLLKWLSSGKRKEKFLALSAFSGAELPENPNIAFDKISKPIDRSQFLLKVRALLME